MDEPISGWNVHSMHSSCFDHLSGRDIEAMIMTDQSGLSKSKHSLGLE